MRIMIIRVSFLGTLFLLFKITFPIYLEFPNKSVNLGKQTINYENYYSKNQTIYRMGNHWRDDKT